MIDPQIKEQLIEIVGEDNYTDSLIDMVSYSYDASEISHRPDCGVWVTTTEQVADILKLANRERIPVIPRGAGTGLSAMCVPIKGGIVVDTCRMNKIIEISIKDRLAIVQPGVVYADLEKALAKYGFIFPPDPGSGKVATIGGNVATNAGGIKGAKYGTTKDYTLGLEVVLPSGQIMRTGSKTMKCVSGFDLTHLMVGSEGTLGVITEVTLKINPKPPRTATARATFQQLDDAGNAITAIMHSGIIPSVLEILGRETISAINANTNLNLPEVEAILLAETDGYTQGEADYQMETILDIFRENNAEDIMQAASEKEAAELWEARKSAYAVLARIKTHFVLEDVTVPMGNITAMLRGIDEIAKKHQLQIATFGHAGDGNLHPQILYDGYDEGQVKRMEAATAELFKLATQLGGTLTGEHGIGLAKAPYMHLEHDNAAMDTMRLIKRSFDPNNILNPGKMALES